MRYSFILFTVLVCSFLGLSQSPAKRPITRAANADQAASPGSIDSLPIKRVILYSNGVAYIERRGFVTGNAEIALTFKQSQVDDVLKSMVVLDLGQGRIGAVSYNSSQPASARTAEIPFEVDASTKDGGGIAEVLSQMQGERVAVNTQRGIVSGAILTVESRKIEASKESPASQAHFLVLASPEGDISNHDLAEVRSIRILDEGTRKDINEFAEATASTRRRDAKTISVTSNGNGRREMVVSYTVSAPIWKTTYRVVLDSEGKPFFQGWAIVDNVGEEDWRDVQLSLISGSPVSFIQNLQKPLYRYRPIIPIPDDLNLKPQIYDPETSTGWGEGQNSGTGSGYGSGDGVGPGSGEGRASQPPNPMFGDTNSNFIVSTGYAGSSVSDALVNEKGGIDTAASGAEIGDLFEYRIEQPVTVQKNRSALIPIIQTKMDGERVSIFRAVDQEENTDDHDTEHEASKRANPRPMSGLLLKNITPMTFEGGSLTVLDGDAYAGEALMERLKPKEQRLISFALDLGTLMRTEQKEDRQPARMVKVVNGVFQVHYFKTDAKTYKLSNQSDKIKTVYIEHPVRKSWILADDSVKPVYTTPRFYRFRIELSAFENKEIAVRENFGMMDTYNLTSLSPKDLELFVSSRSIDDRTRDRLTKLIDLRMKVNSLTTRLEGLNKEIREISSDQQRFRENIEALAKTAEAKQLIGRYIAKANEQESRLEQIQNEKKAVESERSEFERQLAVEIKNFEIE